MSVEQLWAAAELLETVAGNRALLAGLSLEERKRLLKAAGDIYCPDVRERRRLVKARSRRRKADKLQRAETVLAEMKDKYPMSGQTAAAERFLAGSH